MNSPEPHAMLPELDHEIFQKAFAWHKAGKACAIALITQSWGSSPRQAGAGMLICETGDIAGSVSGGCVESDVIEAGHNVIATGEKIDLQFGITDQTAWSHGLSCGGSISIICLPITDDYLSPAIISEINSAITMRKAHCLALSHSTGKAHLSFDQNRTDYHQFSVTPLRQLFIIGASHIAQSLLPMAQSAGFDTTIIDPRDTFLTTQRFPTGTHLIGWPSHHISAPMLDAQTALVTLTHNPAIDDDALTIALASEAFHICALGSRKTHSARLARLAQNQPHIDPTSLNRIKGPAGLAIGATTPAEIAVSILAEIIAAYHQKQTTISDCITHDSL